MDTMQRSVEGGSEAQSKAPPETHSETYSEVVSKVIETCGPDIRLATILGIGKPNRLINALYDEVAARSDLSLTIFTALSLNPPTASSDLESRFITPFVKRLYGSDFPRLKYADDMAADRLPENIHVEEFYTQPGAYLRSSQGQQNYNSLNYTEVADALATKDINLVFQRVAADQNGSLSLSSNTDLTQDVLDRIAQSNKSRPYCVAEIDQNLPWVGGSAVVPSGFFDSTVLVESTDDTLFALPRQPVSTADYAIGFYASLLVKDGGTLQIGIGALADALCYALVLRHTQNDLYKDIIHALNPTLADSPLVREFGGTDPFKHGVYGCSEMVNEGFRVLVENGIMKRRVIDDLAVMSRINDQSATSEDIARVNRQGVYLRGGFYLGSPDFYQWIKEQGSQNNTLAMDRIGRINSIANPEFELEKAQRQHARFMNICMMATPLGSAVSETLPDGRVVSGVGGQYNFVSMAADLPDARSVLMMKAARPDKDATQSNIRWSLANLTIPRHLRDIYVTEYGIADLRFQSDSECIKRMLSITAGSAIDELHQEAVAANKLSSSWSDQEAQLARYKNQNRAETLANSLSRFKTEGHLPDYPLGSDFTDVEQHLVKALQWLKNQTSTKSGLFRTVWHACRPGLPASVKELERMNLSKPDTLKERMTARLLRYALQNT